MMLGELVGFIAPALAGAATYAADAAGLVQLVALAAAGSIEGAALGFAQSRVLKQEIIAFLPGDGPLRRQPRQGSLGQSA
jgi:hypothetical protein